MFKERVSFQGDIYTVIHDYKNGMIEIKNKDRNWDVKLVKRTEVKVVKEIQ
ncbi:hypothetical protein [Ectobacillus funiculus]|uniref:Uncharacterized protein n=1 Tax=Ectobacillus funiculus TaxID=137993 RepID=A0ABV5WFE1_9BACI